MEQMQYVMFKLGEQTYSMELSNVKGIEQNYSVISLPVGPQFVKGLINLRGDVIPVYSLRSKFNMPDNFNGDTKKLLVTFTHNILLAFEVDMVIGIENVDKEKVNKVPIVVKTNETSYMDSIISVNNGIIINISVENILSETEIDDLAQIIDDNK